MLCGKQKRPGLQRHPHAPSFHPASPLLLLPAHNTATTPQVLANAVVLVDKPPRWSSADVVRELKRLLRVQHVGHGGPLDAQAGGLLIVLMGAAVAVIHC